MTTARVPKRTRTTLYMAHLQTRHFDFDAFATSATQARATLTHALRIHARQYDADPEEMVQNFSEDIEVRAVELRTPYRDQQALVWPTSKETAK